MRTLLTIGLSFFLGYQGFTIFTYQFWFIMTFFFAYGLSQYANGLERSEKMEKEYEKNN
jgi:hypothetical protein